jgi:hypothetical protein
MGMFNVKTDVDVQPYVKLNVGRSETEPHV